MKFIGIRIPILVLNEIEKHARKEVEENKQKLNNIQNAYG